MKTISKIFALSLVVLGFSTASFAQSSATATASATLLTPISISKTADMSFGTLASNAVGGSVTLTPAGVISASGTGVRIMNNSTGAAASFTVTGEAGQSFSISHPATITLTSGSNTLTVNSIINDVTNSNSGSGTVATGGTKVINLGGVLVVPANAPKGTYSNTSDLTVTVNYN